MRLLQLYRSVIGKKVIAAVTGAIMMGFLLLHVAGNLKAFLPDAEPGVPDIDVYAHFLRTMGEPLIPYEMAPEDSIDVDTPLDLAIAEFLLRRREQAERDRPQASESR